jgi:hypothetical protein
MDVTAPVLATQAALDERDGEARRLITEYERARKQVAASAAAGASDAEERVSLHMRNGSDPAN